MTKLPRLLVNQHRAGKGSCAQQRSPRHQSSLPRTGRPQAQPVLTNRQGKMTGTRWALCSSLFIVRGCHPLSQSQTSLKKVTRQHRCPNAQNGTKQCRTLVSCQNTQQDQKPQARAHLLVCFQSGVTPLRLQGRSTLLPHYSFCSAISPSPNKTGYI